MIWKVKSNVNNFEDAFHESIFELEYLGDFKNQMKLKTKEFQKKYFKLQLNELKIFFIKLESLIPYIIFCAFVFIFHNNGFIIKGVFSLLFIGLSIAIVFGLINYDKIFKSINLLATTSLFLFALSMMNLFTTVPRLYASEKFVLPIWYFSIILLIIVPFFYTGFKIFFKFYRQYDKVYKEKISTCS